MDAFGRLRQVLRDIGYNPVTTRQIQICPILMISRNGVKLVLELFDEMAVFISTDEHTGLEVVTTIPERPVPIASTFVSDTGDAFVLTINGNETDLSLVTVDNWIAFSDMPKAPPGSHDW